MTLTQVATTFGFDSTALRGWDLTTLKRNVKTARRAMAKRHHPDVGGDATRMRAVNVAADQIETWAALPWAADQWAQIAQAPQVYWTARPHSTVLDGIFAHAGQAFIDFIRQDQAKRRAQQERQKQEMIDQLMRGPLT